MAGAASALFLLDVKGRVLISRDYRGDVIAPQAERAFAKLMEGEGDPGSHEPVLLENGVHARGDFMVHLVGLDDKKKWIRQVLQDLRGEKFDERTTQEKGTALTMRIKAIVCPILMFVAFRCEVKKHMASVLYARLGSGPSTLRTMNLQAVQNSYSLPWLPFKPSRLVDSWF